MDESSEHRDTPTTPSVAPKVAVKDQEVTFSGVSTKGRVSLKDASYNLWLSDVPENAKVLLAGKTFTPGSGGIVDAKIDLSDKIATISPKEAFDTSFKFDPKFKIEVEFGPNAKVSFDAPPVPLWIGLADYYKDAADSPVALAKPSPGAEHTVVSLLSTVPEALGPAKTLKDIDWVAVGENLAPRSGKTCSGYKKTGDDKGPEKSFIVELVDRKVTVFDAATSKVIDSKEFKANNECPMMAFGGNARAYASSDEQKSWLRTLRSSTKKKK